MDDDKPMHPALAILEIATVMVVMLCSIAFLIGFLPDLLVWAYDAGKSVL